MSETENNSGSGGETAALDLAGLGAFDFTPSWAKSAPGDTLKKFRSGKYAGEPDKEADAGERGRRPPRAPGGDPRRPPRREGGRDWRENRRDGRGGNGAPSGDRGFGGPRRFGGQPPPPPPLDADIRVLPDQRALGQIIRKIQTTHHAYPLRELARLFSGNPSSIVVRIARRAPQRQSEGEAARDAAAPLKLFQCSKCGTPALTAAEIEEHAFAAHFADYFTEETVETEPPKGNFPCVAKCGLSGVLIGPPNLHDYNARIHEMIRTRFPGMREEDYRARIEMVRDPEAVEEWRKSAVKKTVYCRKDEQAGEDGRKTVLTRADAERIFREQIAPSMVASPKTVLAPAEAAVASPSRAIAGACRAALAREARNPVSVFYALRGAFHFRKLVFIRADDPRGQEFVSAAAPSPLDTAHAVPELAEIVNYVAANPTVRAKTLVEALAGADAKKQTEVLSRVSWLAERGHIVAFYDGTLAVPAEHPIYRRRKPAKQENPATPENPDGPEATDDPETPENPDASENPATPETPETK